MSHKNFLNTMCSARIYHQADTQCGASILMDEKETRNTGWITVTSWGLFVRSEIDRGIGIQSYEMYQNLRPDRTLVVLDGNSGFASHPELYPGATTVKLKHGPDKNRLDMTTVRDWWAGLDVVIAVETFYDWDVVEWGRADGVRTVVHGNPEFFQASNLQPDTWIWPTDWRLEHLPPGQVVPVPVQVRCSTNALADTGTLRALHIAGNRAMGDRNGTDIVCKAMKRLGVGNGVKLTLHSQKPVAGFRVSEPVADRWELYSGHHVLVLPRRYGGLCLPALEAMACGLAVAMPDCSPNLTWPVIPLNSEPGVILRMQTGDVRLSDTPVQVVADAMKHLANNRTDLAAAQARSREWADANSWPELAHLYYEVLGV